MQASRRRRVGVGVALLLAGLAAWDLTRAASDQVSARALVGGIGIYRKTLSPWADAVGARCRFEPSCSHYGEAVIRRHGTVVGSWMTIERLARCGPWTPAGTADPPP